MSEADVAMPGAVRPASADDAAVLRRFRGLDAGEQARFLNGASFAAARAPCGPRWAQLNVTLVPRTEAYRGFVEAGLDLLFAELRAANEASAFFFMHKPPGLRLRLHGPAGIVEAALLDFGRRLVADGHAVRAVPDVYEPEEYLFGGPIGMDLAHRFFTADSGALLGYFREAYAAAADPAPVSVSVALLDLLLDAILGDRFEGWQVWRDVAALRCTRAGVSAADQLDVIGGLALARDRRAPDPAWLARFRTAMDDLGGIVAAVRAERGLGFGLRAVLPYWIIFHWNRLMFDAGRQGGLAACLAELLAPPGHAADARGC